MKKDRALGIFAVMSFIVFIAGIGSLDFRSEVTTVTARSIDFALPVEQSSRQGLFLRSRFRGGITGFSRRGGASEPDYTIAGISVGQLGGVGVPVPITAVVENVRNSADATVWSTTSLSIVGPNNYSIALAETDTRPLPEDTLERVGWPSWTPPEAGYYTFTACADSGELIDELREDNNCNGTTLEVTNGGVSSRARARQRLPRFPDYVVDSITYSVQGAEEVGNPYTFSIPVTNQGRANGNASSITQVRIKGPGGYSISESLNTSPLPRHTTEILTWSGWTPTVPGTYVVIARADEHQDVIEDVEYNNDGTITIVVNAGAPACASDTWTRVADLPGDSRTESTGFSIAGKGYVGTGFSGTFRRLRDFWEYDPATDTWQRKADFPVQYRLGSTGFAIGNEGYMGTGGGGTSTTPQRDVWNYDPASDTWTQIADIPGDPLEDAVSFSANGKGYIGTGWIGDTNPISNDFWEYNPVTDTWTQKADVPGDLRSDAIGFSINGKGYVGLGFTIDASSTQVLLQDFWEYDPATDTWQRKADFPGGGWAGGASFSISDKGYVGAGFSSDDFWEYNPVTDTWTQKADVPGGVRPEAIGFSANGKGYIGMGYSVNSFGFPIALKDLWEYCP